MTTQGNQGWIGIQGFIGLQGSSQCTFMPYEENTGNFDYNYYRLYNPDVEQVYKANCDGIWEQWTKYGQFEHRIHRYLGGEQGPQGDDSGSGGGGNQGKQGWQGPQGAGLKGTIGFRGFAGPQGAQGDGFQGFQGYIGPIQDIIGNQGNQGDQGFVGLQGVQDKRGSTGDIGNQGNQGEQGFQGDIGLIGLIGLAGWEGNQGFDGDIGYDGFQGFQGFSGLSAQFDGNQGNQGIQGFLGNIGIAGNDGLQGNSGDLDGNDGQVGIQGNDGLQGNVGIMGTVGNVGFQDRTGNDGVQGNIGVYGNVGNVGDQGNQGLSGFVGLSGVSGLNGNVGFQGNTGNDGYTGSQGLQGNIGFEGIIGFQDSTGNDGVQGTSGNDGLQGNTGFQSQKGFDGFQGVSGNDGRIGNIGFTGNIGNIGFQGVIGIQGKQGLQGANGYTGNFGNIGFQDNDGNSGYTGNVGPIGYIGLTGFQGDQGNDGFAGNQGIQGTQGNIGFAGFIGFQANVGNSGLQGVQGLVGNNGLIGLSGFTGQQGFQGVTGVTGRTGRASSLKGPVGNSGFQGLDGWDGPQGRMGRAGNRGNTGLSGLQGNQGNQGGQGFSGFKGRSGNTGNRGNTGQIGNQGNQGIQGSIGFTGRAGNTGNIGTQGTDGFQGNIGLQGQQGNIGLQGVKGEAGFNGRNGNTGSQGSQGNQGSQGKNGLIGLSQFLLADLPNSSLLRSSYSAGDAVGMFSDDTSQGLGAYYTKVCGFSRTSIPVSEQMIITSSVTDTSNANYGNFYTMSTITNASTIYEFNGVTTNSSSIYGTLFVAGFNSDGDQNFFKTCYSNSSTSLVQGNYIVADSNGDVYVSGIAYNTIKNFAGTTKTMYGSSITNVFIAKLDGQTGTQDFFLYAGTTGGGSGMTVTKIITGNLTNGDNNIYIAGLIDCGTDGTGYSPKDFAGNTISAGVPVNQYIAGFNSAGTQLFFLVSYNAAGSSDFTSYGLSDIQASQVSTGFYAYGYINVESNGGIIAFDGSHVSAGTLGIANNVARLSSDGTQQWYKVWGSDSYAYPQAGLALRAENDQVMIAGVADYNYTRQSVLDFNGTSFSAPSTAYNGGSKIFWASLDSTGTQIFFQMGGAQGSLGTNGVRALAITTTFTYIGGWMNCGSGGTNNNPYGFNFATITGYGGTNAFYANNDTSGNAKALKFLGSLSGGSSTGDSVYYIITYTHSDLGTPNEYVIFIGTFHRPSSGTTTALDFDGNTINNTKSGSSNIFLVDRPQEQSHEDLYIHTIGTNTDTITLTNYGYLPRINDAKNGYAYFCGSLTVNNAYDFTNTTITGGGIFSGQCAFIVSNEFYVGDTNVEYGLYGNSQTFNVGGSIATNNITALRRTYFTGVCWGVDMMGQTLSTYTSHVSIFVSYISAPMVYCPYLGIAYEDSDSTTTTTVIYGLATTGQTISEIGSPYYFNNFTNELTTTVYQSQAGYRVINNNTLLTKPVYSYTI